MYSWPTNSASQKNIKITIHPLLFWGECQLHLGVDCSTVNLSATTATTATTSTTTTATETTTHVDASPETLTHILKGITYMEGVWRGKLFSRLAAAKKQATGFESLPGTLEGTHHWATAISRLPFRRIQNKMLHKTFMHRSVPLCTLQFDVDF